MKLNEADNNVVTEYQKEYPSLLNAVLSDRYFLGGVAQLLRNGGNVKNRIYLFGNGGSMATCAHFASDLEKNANIKAEACSDASKITTLANDYGYENIFQQYLKRRAVVADTLIAVSVSGESENLIRAIEYAQKNNIHVVTMTGRSSDNSMLKMNTGGFNLHVASHSYNIVENLHSFALGVITDCLIGKTVYEP